MPARAHLFALLLLALSASAFDKPLKLKLGVTTPGVQIPFANLKPEAEITLPGAV